MAGTPRIDNVANQQGEDRRTATWPLFYNEDLLHQAPLPQIVIESRSLPPGISAAEATGETGCPIR